MKSKYAFSLIVILGALTGQLAGHSTCERCRHLDIRQGPGFAALEENPSIDDIIDNDLLDFEPGF